MSEQNTKKWTISNTQISTSLGVETVILDSHSGRYFSLSDVGNILWDALKRPRSVDDLVAVVSADYNVDAETAERDVRKLLNDLKAAGLVTTC